MSDVAGVLIKCVHISYIYMYTYQSLIVHASICIFTIPHCGVFNHQSHTVASVFRTQGAETFGRQNRLQGQYWEPTDPVRQSIPGHRATGDVRGSNKVMFGCIFSIKGGVIYYENK